MAQSRSPGRPSPSVHKDRFLWICSKDILAPTSFGALLNCSECSRGNAPQHRAVARVEQTGVANGHGLPR